MIRLHSKNRPAIGGTDLLDNKMVCHFQEVVQSMLIEQLGPETRTPLHFRCSIAIIMQQSILLGLLSSIHNGCGVGVKVTMMIV